MTRDCPSETNPVARPRRQELADSARCGISRSGRVSGQILIAARVDGCPQVGIRTDGGIAVRQQKRQRCQEIVRIEIPADEFWGSLFRVAVSGEARPVRIPHHADRREQGTAITNMEPGKRGIRPYFAVEDIKAAAARVTELGGEAGEPAPVPGMGWFSTYTDPHGYEFGLWQTDTSAPAPAQ